jgi:hypothetical protein
MEEEKLIMATLEDYATAYCARHFTDWYWR